MRQPGSRSTAVLLTLLAAPAIYAGPTLMETWESQSQTDPFTGLGDLTWTGYVEAFSVTSATWPTSPAQDFAGSRSLRSTNHPGGSVQTIVTDISSHFNLDNAAQWSIFFSGNSANIGTDRRADFILVADNGNVADLEAPANNVNGYKITLWDPLSSASSNTPPSSHAGAALADSLTLWRVDDSDDRWRVVGSIPLGSTDDLRDGWNIVVRRETSGEWKIGFSNGSIGTPVSLTSVGIDTVADLSGASFFAGVGWLAPSNTSNDHIDFGFDQFQLMIPEPAAAGLTLLTALGLGLRRRC